MAFNYQFVCGDCGGGIAGQCADKPPEWECPHCSQAAVRRRVKGKFATKRGVMRQCRQVVVPAGHFARPFEEIHGG